MQALSRTPKHPEKDREPNDLELDVEEIADLDVTSEAAAQVLGGTSGTHSLVQRARIHAQNC